MKLKESAGDWGDYCVYKDGYTWSLGVVGTYGSYSYETGFLPNSEPRWH